MTLLRGGLRLAATALVLVVGTAVVLALALVPGRVQGARPAGWAVTAMARVAVRVFGVRVRCAWPERLRLHRGLVFANHRSYADPIVLLALFPVRFLSNHAVERALLVGWVARAIGTVFVDRRSDDARAVARRELVEALTERPHPPLVLFPEGRIGQGEGLERLHRGAFEVAQEAGVPYLLVALRYTEPEAVRWRKRESFGAAVWRLARHRGPLDVHVDLLGAVHPSPEDDPGALVSEAAALLGAATAEAAGP